MKATILYTLRESRTVQTALPTAIHFDYSHLMLRWCIALLLSIADAAVAQSQTVSFGAASFTGSSDQVSADWYWPMPGGVTYTYDGYGVLGGATRTETYTLGQWVAGVKTVKWHMETKNAGSIAPTVEDWWLALDVNGNLRVLEIVQSGSIVFAASGGKTPPIFLPNSPAKGQTWDFLGNKLTIEAVLESRNAGAGLTLSIAAPGSPVEYNTYNAGVGLIHDAASAKPAPIGSGWTLREQ
jgi:hypothetical protein